MTAPHPPDDPVVALAGELAWLGRRLDVLGAHLLALYLGPTAAGVPGAAAAPPPEAGPQPVVPPHPPQAHPGAPPPPLGPPHPGAPLQSLGPPHPGAPPPPLGPPHPGAPPSPGVPAGPPPPSAFGSPPPTRPRRPSLRYWLASFSGARLLAWTGAAVTLLGVVLLLALAAARGWFAPPVRVVAGAVLGLGLVGLGARLHRREASRAGALAVTGTGIATLYLVVAAATARYQYLPVPVGLVVALLVAAAGLGLADRWRSLLLGAAALVGAAVLAPVVAERSTPLLVALVLVLQAVATVVALRRRWPVLVGLAAAWPVLYGTAAAAFARPAERWGAAAVSLAVLVVGVAGVLWAGRRGTTSEPALPQGLRIGVLVAAPLPALTFAASTGGAWGGTVAFLAAVLLFAAAALPGPDQVLRVVALAGGAVALVEATAVALDGSARTAVLLGQAVVLLAVAAWLRSRVTLAVGGVVAVVAVLAGVGTQVPPDVLAYYPAAPFVLGTTPQRGALLAGVLVSALVLAAAVTALVASARTGVLGAARLWVPVGIVGLYGAAGLVVALALLVSPTRSGFVAGHAVVTVSWTLVALVLLARGVRRPALRIAGLVLVAAAVAKLVLFDLVALDGLARVAAFLGAGLLLLGAGTRYARLVAEADAGNDAAAGPEPDTVAERP